MHKQQKDQQFKNRQCLNFKANKLLFQWISYWKWWQAVDFKFCCKTVVIDFGADLSVAISMSCVCRCNAATWIAAAVLIRMPLLGNRTLMPNLMFHWKLDVWNWETMTLGTTSTTLNCSRDRGSHLHELADLILSGVHHGFRGNGGRSTESDKFIAISLLVLYRGSVKNRLWQAEDWGRFFPPYGGIWVKRLPILVTECWDRNCYDK